MGRLRGINSAMSPNLGSPFVFLAQDLERQIIVGSYSLPRMLCPSRPVFGSLAGYHFLFAISCFSASPVTPGLASSFCLASLVPRMGLSHLASCFSVSFLEPQLPFKTPSLSYQTHLAYFCRDSPGSSCSIYSCTVLPPTFGVYCVCAPLPPDSVDTMASLAPLCSLF